MRAANFLTFPLLLLLSFCGGERPDIIVGSKNFSESVLLGEIVAQHIEARTDLTVGRRFSLGGTFICHQAMLAGDLDIYPEYTGTALTAILEKPVRHDPAAVFQEVAEIYRKKFDFKWMAPFGFNNTYAMVIRAEDARRDGLRTISDFARVSMDRTIGFSFEFAEREDGYQGFVKAYSMQFESGPRMIDLALIYRALRDGGIDLGVGNSTDGMIQVLDLVILEDDRRYFPPYDAAAVVRQKTLERFPELQGVLNELGGRFTEAEMQKANVRIDGEHEPITQVAQGMLAK
jgi:osmoprotectant transport system substrate-binding protein